jgi:hypothetical protein
LINSKNQRLNLMLLNQDHHNQDSQDRPQVDRHQVAQVAQVAADRSKG